MVVTGSHLNLYAWAHDMSAEEAVDFAAVFPGIGLVLNDGNVEAAPWLSRPPLVDVRTIATAMKTAEVSRKGTKFLGGIILDERNASGLSGPEMTPAAYGYAFRQMHPHLRDAKVPVFTMGLQPVGGWVRKMLRARLFDDEYHRTLPAANGRAFNPNHVREVEIDRVMGTYNGPWILSPAPFRGWWDRALQPIGISGWAELARDPRVEAVALWCAREHQQAPGRWQTAHGLVDRDDQITNIGREVLRELERSA